MELLLRRADSILCILDLLEVSGGPPGQVRDALQYYPGQ